METTTAHLEHHSGADAAAFGQGMRPQLMAAHFQPLNQETRESVPTDCAAFHLNRRPQTLRAWACLENGPIRPSRIFGRLHWKTADLRRLLGVAK